MKSFYSILLFIIVSPLLICQSNLSVIKISDISFRTNISGREKHLEPLDAGAAEFQIQSAVESMATITVLLPTSFTNMNGSDKIPARFHERSAAWSTIDNTTSRTFFDPRQPLTLSLKQHQTIYIWIGGNLHPSALQRAGKYTGSITLTVSSIPKN